MKDETDKRLISIENRLDGLDQRLYKVDNIEENLNKNHDNLVLFAKALDYIVPAVNAVVKTMNDIMNSPESGGKSNGR